MPTNAQQSREIEQFKYRKGEAKVIRLPQGEVIKEIHVYAKGKYTHSTFGGGSPVMKKHGVSDALLRGIECIEDGNNVVKSFNGTKALRKLSKWIQGTGLASYYKKNANDLGDFGSETKGFPDIGADGETTSFVDAFVIPFDGKLSTEYARTRWNLRGKSDAYIRFDFNEITALLEASSDQCDVTHDIDFYVEVVTSPSLVNADFAKWKQIFKEDELTGPAVEKRIDLISSGLQQGFWLTLEKGQDRKPLTFEECLNTKVKVILNETNSGQSILKSTNLLALMMLNENKTDINELQPASAYINFLDNKTFGTALNTGVGSNVERLDLVLTTPSSISYSPNPLIVRVEHDTIGN